VKIIPELIENVHRVQTFQENQARRKEGENNQRAAQKHLKSATEMADVKEFLESLPQDDDGYYSPPQIAQQENNQLDLFSFSESDLSELPESFIKTLNLSPSDELESKIIELIKIAGRPLGVKELIIGLYKKYRHEVTERNPFASKLYRMVQANKLTSIPGKKGYYFLPNPDENDEDFYD